jgi:hypothetical protein
MKINSGRKFIPGALIQDHFPAVRVFAKHNERLVPEFGERNGFEFAQRVVAGNAGEELPFRYRRGLKMR